MPSLALVVHNPFPTTAIPNVEDLPTLEEYFHAKGLRPLLLATETQGIRDLQTLPAQLTLPFWIHFIQFPPDAHDEDFHLDKPHSIVNSEDLPGYRNIGICGVINDWKDANPHQRSGANHPVHPGYSTSLLRSLHMVALHNLESVTEGKIQSLSTQRRQMLLEKF
ncbi:hypothetical protein BJ742DRAFT_734173 [Cladochytrium replicatum]|nr:hypothetical protein BJ742DRAFT_734173 [Cladochytrium replicatum]